MDRMAPLENRTTQIIEMRLHRTPCNFVERTITIEPGQPEEINATEWGYQPSNPERLPIVEIFIGTRNTGRVLGSQELDNYVKFIFEIADHENFIIRGVRAKWFDFRRFRICGCLGGRDYNGRPEEIIPDLEKPLNDPTDISGMMEHLSRTLLSRCAGRLSLSVRVLSSRYSLSGGMMERLSWALLSRYFWEVKPISKDAIFKILTLLRLVLIARRSIPQLLGQDLRDSGTCLEFIEGCVLPPKCLKT